MKSMDDRKRRMTKGAIVKWLLITLAGILLFLWAKHAAYQQRGYDAVGGEILLLLLPLWWWLVENNVRATLEVVKSDD